MNNTENQILNFLHMWKPSEPQWENFYKVAPVQAD